MSCKFTYKEIVKATAYDITDITFKHPFEVLIQNISNTDYVIKNGAKGITLPFDDINFESKSKNGRNGTVFENVLSFSTSEPLNHKQLIYNNHHLIIECMGGSIYIVRTSADGYGYTVDEKDGVANCDMTITNISGAMKVESSM